LVREVHRATGKIDYQPTSGDKAIFQRALETLTRLTGILGLLEKPQAQSDDLTDALLSLLVEVRNQARKARNFELSDLVRAKLGELNIVLEDNPEGTIWRRR